MLADGHAVDPHCRYDSVKMTLPEIRKVARSWGACGDRAV